MKICLVTFFNLYESKRSFANHLIQALQKRGIQTLLIDPPNGLITMELQNQIVSFAPDFTMSFNSSQSNELGKFYWDYLETPHLSVLLDPAFYAVNMARSPLSFFTTVDREDCAWMSSNGVKKIFFWPHAVEAAPLPQKEKIYDVVFLGTFTDFVGLQMEWQQKLKPEEILVLQSAIDRMFRQPLSSLTAALATSFNEFQLDSNHFDFKKVFYYLDNYVRGKDRFELIRSLKDVKVHIFGEPSWNNPEASTVWKNYMKDMDHVMVHPSVTYDESFDITASAKICLNSSPFFKHGSHERILNAFVSGAVPLTTQNGFVEEFFAPGEDLITYSTGKWDNVNEQVKSLLADEKKRLEMAELGKSKVLAHHTWDNRASELVDIWKKVLLA